MEQQNLLLKKRNPDRIEEVVTELSLFWKKHPDLRLGQILMILNENKDPFYIEDDILLKKLKDLNEKGDMHG